MAGKISTGGRSREYRSEIRNSLSWMNGNGKRVLSLRCLIASGSPGTSMRKVRLQRLYSANRSRILISCSRQTGHQVAFTVITQTVLSLDSLSMEIISPLVSKTVPGKRTLSLARPELITRTNEVEHTIFLVSHSWYI